MICLLAASLLACGEESAPTDDTESESESETGPSESANAIMFVSSDVYDGNLGGVAGADATCQQLADAAALDGTFMAWISALGTNASTRITPMDGRYVLTNGSVVASNWAALTDGDIGNAIRIDESGAIVDAAEQSAVWTATQGNGDYLAADCISWTSAAMNEIGRVGDVESMNEGWTNIGEVSCGTQRRIYCVQVGE